MMKISLWSLDWEQKALCAYFSINRIMYQLDLHTCYKATIRSMLVQEFWIVNQTFLRDLDPLEKGLKKKS